MSDTVESALGTQNIAFLEDLYEAYLEDPNSVQEDFRKYFASLGKAPEHTKVGPSFEARSLFNPPSPIVAPHENGGANANGTGYVNGHTNGSANGVTNGARAALRPIDPVVTETAPPSSGDYPTHAVQEEALTNGHLRMAPVGSLRPLSDADTLDIAIRQDRVDRAG